MHLLDKLLPPPQPAQETDPLARYRHRWLGVRYPAIVDTVPDPRHYYRLGNASNYDDDRHPQINHPINVRAYEAGLLRQPFPG